VVILVKGLKSVLECFLLFKDCEKIRKKVNFVVFNLEKFVVPPSQLISDNCHKCQSRVTLLFVVVRSEFKPRF